MFLDILELGIENKTNFVEKKYFDYVISDL